MADVRLRLHRWAERLSLAVLGLGLAVLLFGWGLGLDWLVRVGAHGAAMVPATALSLILVAGAQVLQLRGGRRWSKTAQGLALAVMGFAVLKSIWTLIAYLSAPPDAVDRVALATSLGLVLVAGTTLASGRDGRLADLVTSVMGVIGTLLLLTGIGAYLLDRGIYRENLAFAGMAPHTAVALLLLLISALLSRPDFQLARTAFGDGSGSRAARRMLPVLLLGPLLLAELAVALSRYGGPHPIVWSSAAAAILALATAVLVLRIASYRNREELAQKAEERRLRAALDGLDVAAFVFSTTNQLRLANVGADRLCGPEIPPEHWVFADHFHDLTDRRRLVAADNPTRQLLEGGRVGDVFVGWVDPDGAEHALRFFLRDQPGAEFRVLSVVDETRGWILRENLARTERLDAVGEMAGGISHEMANIFGVVQLSADTALLSDQVAVMRRHLGGIQAACARGATLAERLLSLTRAGPDRRETIDLRRLLSDLDPMVRAVLPPSIQFDLRCQGQDPVPVHVDVSDLQAALFNLILNARNAISDGGAGQGVVTLEAQRDDMLRLRVSDNGPGMPESVRARAFDPFFTTRQTSGGSGLGLAMVDSFARSCGGSVEIASTLGVGTTVTLTLPVQSAQPDRPEAGAPDDLDLSGVHLLVVEDAADMSGVLSDLLSVLGASVTKTATAEAALRHIAGAAPVDVLITDILLPGPRDGYQLAEAAVAQRPGLPVLYMSGYTDVLTREARTIPGLVLRKPFNVTMLAHSVRLSLRTQQPTNDPA